MKTPKELLEFLKKSHPQNLWETLYGENHPEVLPRLQQLLENEFSLGHLNTDEGPFNWEDFLQYQHERSRNWAETQLNIIMERLPIVGDALKLAYTNDLFAIGILDIPLVNAQALRAPNGGWLITLNRGLSLFLYEIARLLSTRFNYEGDDTEPSISFEDMSYYLAGMFTQYANRSVPITIDYSITFLQLEVAEKLANYAEYFVLCHEIAHIMLGHLETNRHTSILVNNIAIDKSITSWNKEFEADLLGLNMLIKCAETNSSGENPLDNEQVMFYSGADFFLQTMSLFEELANFPASETHPPSAERLKQLRKEMIAHCNDDATKKYIFQVAEGIEFIFTKIRETIIEKIPSWMENEKELE